MFEGVLRNCATSASVTSGKVNASPWTKEEETRARSTLLRPTRYPSLGRVRTSVSATAQGTRCFQRSLLWPLLLFRLQAFVNMSNIILRTMLVRGSHVDIVHDNERHAVFRRCAYTYITFATNRARARGAINRGITSVKAASILITMCVTLRCYSLCVIDWLPAVVSPPRHRGSAVPCLLCRCLTPASFYFHP